MSESITNQVAPETSSDQRMHVLDETCWCGPEVVEITTFGDSANVNDVVHNVTVSE